MKKYVFLFLSLIVFVYFSHNELASIIYPIKEKSISMNIDFVIILFKVLILTLSFFCSISSIANLFRKNKELRLEVFFVFFLGGLLFGFIIDGTLEGIIASSLVWSGISAFLGLYPRGDNMEEYIPF